MKSRAAWFAAAYAVVTLASGAAFAQQSPARPSFDANGVVQVPAFELPPSAFMSPEAVQLQQRRAQMPHDLPTMDPDIVRSRAALARMLAPQVAAMQQAYPVSVVESEIGGVPVRIVTPADGRYERGRVLINLHGGAFTTCWEACSILESAPIAALGRYRVISVNYRMAPEYAHPAGAEDVATVYRELLRDYSARRIGLFGCSAGGALTAQATAWFATHDLPRPAAIGIFGAGAVRFGRGDSAYVAAYIDGSFPPPAAAGQPELDMTRGYFANADMGDEIVSPALHPNVIGRFPPTLIITGTRAMDLSPAIYTNSQLVAAGVRSTLIVGEGMGHCYMYMPNLPEARQAHEATVAFFRENLR